MTATQRPRIRTILLLIFTVIPVTELFLLLWLASVTSVWFTLGLILTTALVGAMLVRWQGLLTLMAARRDLAQGRFPKDQIMDGLMLLVAGALLLTPGLLTDAMGFALLVPPVRLRLRTMAMVALGRMFSIHVAVGGPGRGARRPPVAPTVEVRPGDSPFRDETPFGRLSR
jgi:UPF0716 protein FxsA